MGSEINYFFTQVNKVQSQAFKRLNKILLISDEASKVANDNLRKGIENNLS